VVCTFCSNFNKTKKRIYLTTQVLGEFYAAAAAGAAGVIEENNLCWQWSC